MGTVSLHAQRVRRVEEAFNALPARYLGADPPEQPPPPGGEPQLPSTGPDRTAPKGRLRRLPTRIRRRTLARQGVRMRVEVDEVASVDVTLAVRRRSRGHGPARRHRTAVLVHLKVPVGAGPFDLRLRPGRRARSRRYVSPLTVVARLRDRAGNRTTLRARVRLT